MILRIVTILEIKGITVQTNYAGNLKALSSCQGNRIWEMGFRLSRQTGAGWLIGQSPVDLAWRGSGVSGCTPLKSAHFCAFVCT